MPRTLAPTAGRWREDRASSYDNKEGSSFPAPWFFGGAVVRSRSGESGGCYGRLWVEHARYGTPSPGPPPLVKARVAVHPLPQGGEGWDFFLGGVLKCRNSTCRPKGRRYIQIRTLVNRSLFWCERMRRPPSDPCCTNVSATPIPEQERAAVPRRHLGEWKSEADRRCGPRRQAGHYEKARRGRNAIREAEPSTVP